MRHDVDTIYKKKNEIEELFHTPPMSSEYGSDISIQDDIFKKAKWMNSNLEIIQDAFDCMIYIKTREGLENE